MFLQKSSNQNNHNTTHHEIKKINKKINDIQIRIGIFERKLETIIYQIKNIRIIGNPKEQKEEENLLGRQWVDEESKREVQGFSIQTFDSLSFTFCDDHKNEEKNKCMEINIEERYKQKQSKEIEIIKNQIHELSMKIAPLKGIQQNIDFQTRIINLITDKQVTLQNQFSKSLRNIHLKIEFLKKQLSSSFKMIQEITGELYSKEQRAKAISECQHKKTLDTLCL